jgi:hypothetical protein
MERIGPIIRRILRKIARKREEVGEVGEVGEDAPPPSEAPSERKPPAPSAKKKGV